MVHLNITAMTSPQTPAVLDPNALDTLRRIGGGDVEFFAEMVQIFLEDSPPRLREISAALARGDVVAVYKAAHSLKGGASNFGAVEFRALAEKLEHAGKAGDVAALPGIFAALDAEYPRVVAALQALIKPA